VTHRCIDRIFNFTLAPPRRMTTPAPTAPREIPGVVAPEAPVAAPPKRRMPSVDELFAGVRGRNRAMLGRAFTLVESLNPAHRVLAEQLLERLLPHTGRAVRVGVTGVPGAGKSTFLEAIGTMLTKKGRLVAVLAVDPSSELSGGSILGDKTRMECLAASDAAIIRPSPSGAVPGGVARATRESILVAEAAGFDVVFVETVGVGQAETDVAWMTDFFLLLTVTGTGDELQGIKRGVLELADAVAVNKADGDNAARAKAARAQLASALALLRSDDAAETPVATCSSVSGDGIEALWTIVEDRVAALRASGELDAKRRLQAARWMKQSVRRLLEDRLRDDEATRRLQDDLLRRVEAGELLPYRAAGELVDFFLRNSAARRTDERGKTP